MFLNAASRPTRLCCHSHSIFYPALFTSTSSFFPLHFLLFLHLLLLFQSQIPFFEGSTASILFFVWNERIKPQKDALISHLDLLLLCLVLLLVLLLVPLLLQRDLIFFACSALILFPSWRNLGLFNSPVYI